MSDPIEQILTRSRAPGRMTERRRFTLARHKAIAKLREFSLRHPQQYILELVQAAVFAGATWIAVDVRPGSALVAFIGGQPFKAEELENIFDYLFADRGQADTRHLVQLAVGLNALLQRNPKRVRIESGDGSVEGTVRVDMDREGEGKVGRPEDPLSGTYLLAELGGGWLKRFTGVSMTPEQALIESRCLYTPVPILLNGDAPFGYRAGRHIELFGVRDAVPFDDGQVRGVVATQPRRSWDSGFRVVVGGVWITTLPLPELGQLPSTSERELAGVVCDDRLRKTADQSDIVQDGRYIQMVRGMRPHALPVLQRYHGTGWRPPVLPEPVEEEAEQEALEPLPDVIPGAGPRVGLMEDHFQGLAGEGAVFRIEHDATAEVEEAVDPARFPWRVLVLSDGQALSLAHSVQGVDIPALRSVADVDFVRRILTRNSRVEERDLPFSEQGFEGRLRLRLHLEGALPAWGLPGTEGLPAAVVQGSTRWCGLLPLRLPGLSAVLELDQPRLSEGEGKDRTLIRLLSDAILHESWRLTTTGDGPVERALRAAVLALHARPRFSGEGDRVQLHVSLPSWWGEVAQQLRTAPLLQAAQGVRSLDDLVGLFGTDRVEEVLESEEMERLHPLEDRFGFGHLHHDFLSRRSVAAVGHARGRWFPMDEHYWGVSALERSIWLSPTFGPVDAGEHWEEVPSPIPGVHLAVRPGSPAPESWDEGLAVLYQLLVDKDSVDAWSELAGEGISEERIQGMGRLATKRLAAHLGRAEDGLLLRASDGSRRDTLAAYRADASFSVAPRHGIKVAEPSTVLLTLDELLALPGQVPLRYDDAPEVWDSLADPDADGWLVRQEVRAPGLQGWLGLRLPFDATSGVFVQTRDALVALPELEHRTPCHGLLWLTGGAREITEGQRELLALAGLRMYQRLAVVLAQESDAVRRQAARSYGIAYAALWWHRLGKLGGTAQEIARQVRMLQQGEPWGTLEKWLRTPADQRPPAPVHLRLPASTTALAERTEGDTDELAMTMAKRLQEVVSKVDPELEVSVGRRSMLSLPPVVVEWERSHPQRVFLVLNHVHPLVYRASWDHGRLWDVLLLELVRQVARWAEQRGMERLDLLEMQRIVVAQRVS